MHIIIVDDRTYQRLIVGGEDHWPTVVEPHNGRTRICLHLTVHLDRFVEKDDELRLRATRELRLLC